MQLSPERALSRESSILGYLLLGEDEPLPASVRKLIEHAPESFSDGRLGVIAQAIKESIATENQIDLPSIRKRLAGRVEDQFLLGLVREGIPKALADQDAQDLLRAYTGRKRVSVLQEGLEQLVQHPEHSGTIARQIVRSLSDLEGADSRLDQKLELLKQRRFDPAIEPPPFKPVYSLSGIPISTPGNVAVIAAQPKAGKSSFIGALLAASLIPEKADQDCLGVEARPNAGRAIIHFDTEQSPEDHWRMLRRVMQRAEVSSLPPWLHSYCLTGYTAKECLELVKLGIANASEQHNGVFSIIIDGVADLVSDVNDPTECNALVAELQSLAIQYQASLVSVIHYNPGGNGKTRGHLGSQLERKAETNLQLEKKGEVVEVFSTKQRRAPILRGKGPSFTWSDDAGMHVSQTQIAKPSELELRVQTFIPEALPSGRPMRYTELRDNLARVAGIEPKTAERWMRIASKAKLIRKNGSELYVRNGCE